jgi:hypothetical protein
MNTECQKLGIKESQKEGKIDFVLKFACSVIVIIVSLTMLVGANEGNMLLSLAWPILLLPLLSASKELCVLLSRFIQMSH